MDHLEINVTTQERSLLILCLGLAAGMYGMNRSMVADIIDLAAKLSAAFNEAEAKSCYAPAQSPLEN
jgi:hypothetical protein